MMLFKFNPTYPVSLIKLTLALIWLRDYIYLLEKIGGVNITKNNY